MQVSAGSLDGLVGFSFGAAQFAGLTVTSFAQAPDGSVLDVLTQVLGAPTALAAASGVSSYSVGATDDAAGQIRVDQYGSGGFLQSVTYNVVGYTAQAVLVSPLTLAALIAALQAGQNVVGQIGAIANGVPPGGSNLVFSPAGTFTGALACFALGTRIRTAYGDVPVEDVRVGEMIPGQVSGRLHRVRWVGRRTVDLTRHPRPWDAAPVRVCAGALAPGMPRRDLRLSPDHAVLVQDVLIPVRYLLNGASVVQQWVDSVTYLHVELDAHDVLLAEGLPCESFLDTGNRNAFAAAAPYPARSWRPPARVLGTVSPQQHGDPP
jgi:hypothetical protein